MKVQRERGIYLCDYKNLLAGYHLLQILSGKETKQTCDVHQSGFQNYLKSNLKLTRLPSHFRNNY
jgi:hypothetical protein